MLASSLILNVILAAVVIGLAVLRGRAVASSDYFVDRERNGRPPQSMPGWEAVRDPRTGRELPGYYRPRRGEREGTP